MIPDWGMSQSVVMALKPSVSDFNKFHLNLSTDPYGSVAQHPNGMDRWIGGFIAQNSLRSVIMILKTRFPRSLRSPIQVV